MAATTWRVQGPNGFYREYQGTAEDPLLTVTLKPVRNTASPDATLHLMNRDTQNPLVIVLEDLAYGEKARTINLAPASSMEILLGLARSLGWHDFRIRVQGKSDFEQRYAGHIENGQRQFQRSENRGSDLR